MKSLNFSILILSLIFFLEIKAQTSQAIEINGHLDGFSDGVELKMGNRFNKHMDSCKLIGGNFHLKGDIPDAADVTWGYKILLYNGRISLSDNEEAISVFAQKGDNITIQGKVNQLRDAKIYGSKSNDAILWARSLVLYADSCRSKIIHRVRKIRDSIGYDQKLVGEQVAEWHNMDRYLDSATKNPPIEIQVGNVYQIGIAYMINVLHEYFGGYHGYFQKDMYDKISPAVKHGLVGREVRNLPALSIGQPFPAFSLSTPEGNKIALRDFLQKGKITLVHFWGTNSVEVGKYQKELKIFYKKYHSKGLNVIGIAADTSLQEWKDYVEMGGYPWTNVIAEPKGWEKGSLINDAYEEGCHGIPNTTNVLLDKQGKILAWDVDGPLLQWYLEKYLGQVNSSVQN